MRNYLLGLRAPTLGACVLLALAACGNNKTRPPGVGTGDDLVIAVPPGSFGVRRVDVVGIPPGEMPPADGDVQPPAPQANGMMPPRLDALLRIEADHVTHLDGLDIADTISGEHPDIEVLTYRNVLDASGLTFELDLLDSDGGARHVQFALTKASPDLLVGLLRYETIAPKTGTRAGGTYRVELERRADPRDD